MISNTSSLVTDVLLRSRDRSIGKFWITAYGVALPSLDEAPKPVFGNASVSRGCRIKPVVTGGRSK